MRLPRRLPSSIAMEMLITGRRMKIDEAKHYGLVNRSCPLKDLQSKAIEWAHEISKSAPLSLASIKAIVRETEDMSLESAYKLMRSGSIKPYQKMLQSDDAKEGLEAFNAKRMPIWKGK